MKIFSSLAQIIFAAVIFLGASAEVASHMLDHGSYWKRNIEAILSWFKPPDPAKLSRDGTSPRGRCIRYDKRPLNLHCDEKDDPADRILCSWDIPPAEPVCAEYAPPG